MPCSRDSIVARTYPPAKLNLFLELLGRRDDGYHEIDTVMVPIDWCDELRVRATTSTEICLRIDWEPSLDAVAAQLGIEPNSEIALKMLHLPSGGSNLVHRALDRFREIFSFPGGYDVQLSKQIPAGAGMGGASSDAAAALRCAAALGGIPPQDPRLVEIAAKLGSDVPFFLGLEGETPVAAARGTGRGERIEPLEMRHSLAAVVVFPAISLSTAEVYSIAQLPKQRQTPITLIDQLSRGESDVAAMELVNRLSEPAKKLAPRISEVLESLWHLGLSTCQMTGSGSACFALANSYQQAEQLASQARSELQPGAFVRSVRTVNVPAPIDMIPFDEL